MFIIIGGGFAVDVVETWEEAIASWENTKKVWDDSSIILVESDGTVTNYLRDCDGHIGPPNRDRHPVQVRKHGGS